MFAERGLNRINEIFIRAKKHRFRELQREALLVHVIYALSHFADDIIGAERERERL